MYYNLIIKYLEVKINMSTTNKKSLIISIVLKSGAFVNIAAIKNTNDIFTNSDGCNAIPCPTEIQFVAPFCDVPITNTLAKNKRPKIPYTHFRRLSPAAFCIKYGINNTITEVPAAMANCFTALSKDKRVSITKPISNKKHVWFIKILEQSTYTLE